VGEPRVRRRDAPLSERDGGVPIPDPEIEALVRAAEQVSSRRRFVRNATLAAAWATPIIESLVVVPEADAQGHGHGHGGGTQPPHGHGH
jgi:hypothetical protein